MHRLWTRPPGLAFAGAVVVVVIDPGSVAGFAAMDRRGLDSAGRLLSGLGLFEAAEVFGRVGA